MTNRELTALLKLAMLNVPPGERLHVAALLELQMKEIKRLRAKVREMKRRMG